MKSKISELMDGELDTVNANEVIIELKKKNDLLSDWETYHVISEALRQPAASIPINVVKQVNDRLLSEPILLTPRISYLYKRKLVTLSAAASFVTVVSGWLVMQIIDAQQETLIAEQANNKAVVQVYHPVPFRSSSAFTLPLIPHHPGDYSLIHREFSSNTMMHAPATSAHQVEDREEESR
ncbi:sigma-E factor negative regulatory protein [Nitrosomonas communis]|uniref:sigma-E factor negative regulatory protein n=1 Tax=Nitrosomonas communis TaxID=44574 RepID=UPI0026EF855F|nr:sigma-E factor negative regulatory protein [Nitrosomonas communis]MCO6426529.1 sigma-E factor negative regulatory protein [Nitrosomonas communis]